MTRRLLVTGGAGFIGAHFCAYWRRTHPGDRLVILDALTYAGDRAALAALDGDPDFRFVHGDIGDEPLVRALFSEESIDTVVHFAAESHVDRSIDGPRLFLQTNVIGTSILLDAARAHLASGALPPERPFRFHHVSTDEVYGSLDLDAPAFTERSRYAPSSPYAASKAASDHLVRAYHRTYDLPITISNCSNNYGARQFPEKLIPLMLVHALHGWALPVYGDGAQRRDWLHVEDHCRGIERVLERGVVGETYNIGGGTECSNLELVTALCARIDARFRADPTLAARFPDAPAARGIPSTSRIVPVTDRPGHDRRYAIDCTRARTELGYAPRHTLDAGLDATISWYLAHEEWWRPRVKRP